MVFAQHQYDNWHFGYYRAINFSNGIASPVTGSQIIADETCSSISDTAGNLLFYTNGNAIWDKNCNVMPNGTGLLGWGDVQQGVLVVPFPNQNDKYFVFTIGNPTGPYTKELRYSIIDMSLNNSLGDVSLKNVLLDSDVTEKLTATKHKNGNAFWIISHPFQTNQFKAYLVDTSGINVNPVISNVGLIPSSLSIWAFAGAIKISNNGCWLLSTYRESNSAGTGLIELFHYDNSTGILTGNASKEVPHPYGLEFSPNNSKFYISQNTSAPILQFDLLAGNDSLIMASETPASDTLLWVTLGMQLAPDNKIYFIGYSETSIGAIELPDNSGYACNINPTAITFTDTISQNTSSLPNNFNLIYSGELDCKIPVNIETHYNTFSNVNLFPNPSKGLVEIQISGVNKSKLTFTIFNLLGRRVFTTEIDGNIHKNAVNLSHLANGSYVYHISDDNCMIVTGKLFIIK